jgi:hypothetical protein
MRLAIAAVVLVLAAAVAAAAQDQALDPLLFVGTSADGGPPATLTGARTFQLYRIPLDYTLRPMDAHHWGISLSCPVSLSGVRVQRTTNASTFVHSLGVFALVPGIAFDIPLAEGVRLHPFAEAGVGKGSDRHETEVLYGAGASVRVDRRAGSAALTFGGSAQRQRLATDVGAYEAHSTFEGGIDAQVPLGFSFGRRTVRGGGYAIARAFDGLVLKRPGLEPASLGHQFEAGASLSTAPELHVWKITLPWVAVGYQFGPVIHGVRVYTSFPF